MAKYVRRKEETFHEVTARVLMAIHSRKDPDHFSVVRRPDPEIWYDWADPETKTVGQCRLNTDGTWHQDPRGEEPVILAYRAPAGANLNIRDEITAVVRAREWLGNLVRRDKLRHRRMRLRMITEFGNESSFEGTVKVAEDETGGLCYVVHVRGLKDRQAERLCRFLAKLK